MDVKIVTKKGRREAAGEGQAHILIRKIKCNVHLLIAKLMLKNVSINSLFKGSFRVRTVVGGLGWD